MVMDCRGLIDGRTMEKVMRALGSLETARQTMRRTRQVFDLGLGLFAAGFLLFQACVSASAQSIPPGPAAPAKAMGNETASQARRRAMMVAKQLRGRDIQDQRVLEAMSRVRRHEFVPATLESMAYDDGPLPIGHGQTISQPYIVALMTQLAAPTATDRVLDVGTGSGYQAAVLAELAGDVSSIEIVEPLAREARERLARLGYRNVSVRWGDGWKGLPERAPFQVIVLAAAPRDVPPALLEQLAPGGRLVLPVGDNSEQKLLLITKRPDGSFVRRQVAPVLFVPMTGDAQTESGTVRKAAPGR
jgi:protein-L-isoaspartate(D-aspartate) O-methyltransferase